MIGNTIKKGDSRRWFLPFFKSWKQKPGVVVCAYVPLLPTALTRYLLSPCCERQSEDFLGEEKAAATADNVWLMDATVFETGSYSIATAGVQLIVILLPQSPKCWDCKCDPLHTTFFFFFFGDALSQTWCKHSCHPIIISRPSVIPVDRILEQMGPGIHHLAFQASLTLLHTT